MDGNLNKKRLIKAVFAAIAVWGFFIGVCFLPKPEIHIPDWLEAIVGACFVLWMTGCLFWLTVRIFYVILWNTGEHKKNDGL